MSSPLEILRISVQKFSFKHPSYKPRENSFAAQINDKDNHTNLLLTLGVLYCHFPAKMTTCNTNFLENS